MVKHNVRAEDGGVSQKQSCEHRAAYCFGSHLLPHGLRAKSWAGGCDVAPKRWARLVLCYDPYAVG